MKIKKKVVDTIRQECLKMESLIKIKKNGEIYGELLIGFIICQIYLFVKQFI